ncbi:hypothetical protein QF042_004334 [Pedobacter sp. W3I1]|nr:hypothetical protein [Pedobacter sp. W3I1]
MKIERPFLLDVRCNNVRGMTVYDFTVIDLLTTQHILQFAFQVVWKV